MASDFKNQPFIHIVYMLLEVFYGSGITSLQEWCLLQTFTLNRNAFWNRKDKSLNIHLSWGQLQGTWVCFFFLIFAHTHVNIHLVARVSLYTCFYRFNKLFERWYCCVRKRVRLSTLHSCSAHAYITSCKTLKFLIWKTNISAFFFLTRLKKNANRVMN